MNFGLKERPRNPLVGHVHDFRMRVDYGLRCGCEAVATSVVWDGAHWIPRCVLHQQLEEVAA